MKYFLAFLASIGLIILVFLLILRGFSGNGGTKPTPLINYARTGTIVQLMIDGETNADQEHRAIRITVSRSESRIEILNGYEYTLAESKSFVSNEEAYANFLRAIELLGYTKGIDDPKRADERGYCAAGQRQIFSITRGSKDVQRYWTTTCGGGTFKGNKAKIIQLFRHQIPEYSKLVRKVDL